MKQITTKILCDCCHMELNGTEGVNGFNPKWMQSLRIEVYGGTKEIKDLCRPCNDALLNAFYTRAHQDEW